MCRYSAKCAKGSDDSGLKPQNRYEDEAWAANQECAVPISRTATRGQQHEPKQYDLSRRSASAAELMMTKHALPTWRPSAWGKALTSSGDWQLALHEEIVTLTIGGVAIATSVEDFH